MQIFVLFSKCSGGIIISFMDDYASFHTRMDFIKMFVMSLDFANVKTMKTCPKEWHTGRIKPVSCYILI